MDKEQFYRYTKIIFTIKQQRIEIDDDIKSFVKEALLYSDMQDDEIFLEVANYYDIFK